MIDKIISGGQTGADMAGLVVAKELDIKTGGTAPIRWSTENGPQKDLLESFGLVEGPQDPSVYIKRTMMNIDDADGTLVFRPFKSKGTDMTIGYTQQGKWAMGVLQYPDGKNIKTFHRPLYVIRNFDNFDAEHIVEWIKNNKIKTLNVAGPRESHKVGLQKMVEKILKKILTWEIQTKLDL